MQTAQMRFLVVKGIIVPHLARTPLLICRTCLGSIGMMMTKKSSHHVGSVSKTGPI